MLGRRIGVLLARHCLVRARESLTEAILDLEQDGHERIADMPIASLPDISNRIVNALEMECDAIYVRDLAGVDLDFRNAGPGLRQAVTQSLESLGLTWPLRHALEPTFEFVVEDRPFVVIHDEEKSEVRITSGDDDVALLDNPYRSAGRRVRPTRTDSEKLLFKILQWRSENRPSPDEGATMNPDTLVDMMENLSEQDLESIDERITAYRDAIARLQKVRRLVVSSLGSPPARSSKRSETSPIAKQIIESIGMHGAGTAKEIADRIGKKAAGVAAAARFCSELAIGDGRVIDLAE